ncbi:MAG: hypothetical protein OIF32_08750 [Campylobacterales bacterium]|nr:hypothetical protein [Campylobacterales bacterium]
MKQWLNSLKIAVVNQDEETIAKLYETIPDFDKTQFPVEELKEAEALIPQAISILKEKRDESGKVMSSIKASITYQRNM